MEFSHTRIPVLLCKVIGTSPHWLPPSQQSCLMAYLPHLLHLLHLRSCRVNFPPKTYPECVHAHHHDLTNRHHLNNGNRLFKLFLFCLFLMRNTYTWYDNQTVPKRLEYKARSFSASLSPVLLGSNHHYQIILCPFSAIPHRFLFFPFNPMKQPSDCLQFF